MICHGHARTLVDAQKLVETWGREFWKEWKEWKLGRVGVVFWVRHASGKIGDVGVVGRFGRSNAFGWRVYAKLRRAGFRQALWASMWFQMATSRSGHERMWLEWCAREKRVHPYLGRYLPSFMLEFGPVGALPWPIGITSVTGGAPGRYCIETLLVIDPP